MIRKKYWLDIFFKESLNIRLLNALFLRFVTFVPSWNWINVVKIFEDSITLNLILRYFCLLYGNQLSCSLNISLHQSLWDYILKHFPISAIIKWQADVFFFFFFMNVRFRINEAIYSFKWDSMLPKREKSTFL